MERGTLQSFILWGPPGTGKTTIAEIFARQLGIKAHLLSAINSGVRELKAVIDEATQAGNPALLFIDEIHRFNKLQQDALLGAVEKGVILLIGATTENPSFEVNKALLSRCRVFRLRQLSEEDLWAILEKGIGFLEANDLVTENGQWEIIRFSGGDARKLLNILEICFHQAISAGKLIDGVLVNDAVQENAIYHDKSGEDHYDVVSALIKSIRGSDPQASIYWLARMVETGEPPEFIARRLLILAAEDIGLANPNALLLANAVFESVLKIGWPESRIILSECCLYLAMSEKSNSAYRAINEAQDQVRKIGPLPVPLHLRNAVTSLMKQQGYGMEYKYPHDFPGNFTEQEYLPEGLKSKSFFEAGKGPREQELFRQWKTRTQKG